MKSELERKLKEQILDLARIKVDIDMITGETNLIQNFGFDSILMVQMIAELEYSFDILFEDEDLDMEILANFSKLKELIEKKIESNEVV